MLACEECHELTSLKMTGEQNIKGETRLAITTHEMAEVGVCLKHTLEPCKYCELLCDGFDVDPFCDIDTLLLRRTAASTFSHGELKRTIDLDVDIGSDAVDYK